MKNRAPLQTSLFTSTNNLPQQPTRRSNKTSTITSGNNKINGKIYHDIIQDENQPQIDVNYESIVVCDTNHKRAVVRKTILASDEPLTHYERNLLFMGQLRNDDIRKGKFLSKKKPKDLDKSVQETQRTLESMQLYNMHHNISVTGSNYGKYNVSPNAKRGTSVMNDVSRSRTFSEDEDEGVGSRNETAPLPFPSKLVEKLNGVNGSINESIIGQFHKQEDELNVTNRMNRHKKEVEDDKIGGEGAEEDGDFADQVAAMLVMLE